MDPETLLEAGCNETHWRARLVETPEGMTRKEAPRIQERSGRMTAEKQAVNNSRG